MSSNRSVRFAALLSLSGPTTLAAATTCPLSVDRHRLIDVQVFDGPPSRLADMIPIEGAWKLDYSPILHNHYYLGCHYEGRAGVYEVSVPTSATLCRIQVSPRTHMLMNVVCE